MNSPDETQFLLDRLGGGAKLAIDGLRQQLATVEAEVERLRNYEETRKRFIEKYGDLTNDGKLRRIQELEIERDRYKGAVDDANEELKRGNAAAAGSWLRAALYQREES